jgi:hypothetical protein
MLDVLVILYGFYLLCTELIHVIKKGLQAAGHNISAASIIQLKVSRKRQFSFMTEKKDIIASSFTNNHKNITN